MGKTKHSKNDEFAKSQIRHLKKEIRRKDQEIRRLEKQLGFDQYKTIGKRIIKGLKEAVEHDLNSCPDCGKGVLKISDLGIRTITTCSLCTYRKVSK